MKLILNLVVSALMAVGVAGQCSLCPGGSDSITDVNAQLIATVDSCGVIEARLNGVSNANCVAARAEENTEFDQTAFCCSDATVSNVECLFCGGGSFDPERVLGPETNPNGFTCAEAKTIVDYTKDSSSVTCRSLLNINAGCCQASCSICPQGSTMTNGARLLPGQTLTCGDLDVALGLAATEEACTAQLQAFADYDLAAYCECSGSPSPRTCDFCEFGIADRTAVVPETGGLTCSQFERLADYIKSDGVCSDWQGCCNGPPGTIAPASSSTKAMFVAVAIMTTAVTMLL